MYEKAALVTVISPAFREYLCERSGLTSEKIQVVPNFVDTNIIRPLPRENPYAARMDFTHRFVVAHSGNLGYVYDLMTLIDAAKILSDQDDIVFAIIGDGVLNEALKRKAELNRLNNVRFLPFQPEEDLPWLRASIDVHLALYVPGAARYSMPSKVYEIMASGRPVLASAESGSDVYRLLRESRAGVCIDPSDAGGLAEAVIQLRDDPAGRDEMGALGRRHVEENYSVPRVVSQYEQLLAEVAERSPR
jgi:colanic acid biosynthesis glycosyl transferase WcaI